MKRDPKLSAVTRVERECLRGWCDAAMDAIEQLTNLINDNPWGLDLPAIRRASLKLNSDAVHINALCMRIQKETDHGDEPPF